MKKKKKRKTRLRKHGRAFSQYHFCISCFLSEGKKLEAEGKVTRFSWKRAWFQDAFPETGSGDGGVAGRPALSWHPRPRAAGAVPVREPRGAFGRRRRCLGLTLAALRCPR